MEEHRLKPMQDGYDEKLFTQLYKELTPLKKKLASNIDYKRFGVTYDDLLSWFDVKFIFTFNKYYHIHNPNVLRGHLISALSFFKNRILRQAYKEKYSQNIIDLGSLENADNILKDRIPEDNYKLFRLLLFAFMQQRLHEDAYMVFQTDLNPPTALEPYLEYHRKKIDGKFTKVTEIPPALLATYIGLPDNEEGINYIKKLRKLVSSTLEEAKEYFKTYERIEQYC